MKTLRLISLVSLVFTVSLAAQDQQKLGSIAGKVYGNATKEPLPFANVVVVGTTLGAATDLEGRFVIPRVPTGTYSVRASILGYTPMIESDVVVSTARPSEVDFALVETQLEFEEVEVTAEYFRKLPDKPLSTQFQSNEEIRRLPGGLEDVARAISILPGVAQVQAGRNDLIVRGGSPSENLFVIDNIEVPNINHFGTQGATGGPLSFINLDFVQSTSFSSGGFGARYGDKLSSVLSIDLREGRKDRHGGKATISASQFGLNLEGPLSQNGESGSYIFSARRSYLDLIFKAAGFGFVPEYWDFLGKATYQLSKVDQLNFLGIAALDNVRLFNDTPDKRFDNSRVLASDQNQVIGGISWRHILSSGYTTLSLGRTFVDFAYKQNDSLLNPIFTNSSFEDEWSLRGDLVWQLLKSSEISFGAQGKFIRFHADMFLRPFQTNFGQQISIDRRYDTTAFKAVAFAQFSQQVGRLRVVLGGRVDFFSLIEDNVSFSPRLSASYAISPVTNLNASVGRYNQAPSYIWLISNPMNGNLSYIGVNQYVAGIDHLVRTDTKVSLEAYLKRYSDYPASLTRPYLVLANTGAGFGGSEEGFASFGLDPLVSSGRGEAHGIELFVQKKLSEIPCYGTISMSFNESRFEALDGISRPSSFDQRWIVNLGGGYIFDEKWEISTKFRYATGRPYTPFNPDGTQDVSLYNSQRVVANHSLDVRIDRRWTFDRWNLITYVDIQNIYNRKPVDVPRYNRQTGELERVGSIGILPSVGISAEF
ncbi:MAG: TonB-dependent receptor [Ignavibacteria bacterium]|nr:TonB-dependent receptor [Ignavibacteria bacterium]